MSLGAGLQSRGSLSAAVIFGGALAVAVTLGIDVAFAISDRVESVEWQTDTADAIVLGIIKGIQKTESVNEYWDSQKVTVEVLDVIKGKSDKTLTFQREFRSKEYRSIDGSGPAENGDRFLVFLTSPGKRSKPSEVTGWFNLSRPDQGPLGHHVAYNNDCKVLTNENSIVSIVRKRTSERKRLQRGLLVDFKPPRGMYVDLVITAEPQYRQQFVDQLQAEFPDNRCFAIFNLVSYPGDETVRLIEPLLQDDATAEVQNYDGQGRNIIWYPVRQAAYVGLSLLGAAPPLPKPYFDQTMPSPFNTGFDNEDFFPKGNWRRLKDIVAPVPKFPFRFLTGQTPVAQFHKWNRLDYMFAFEADFSKTRQRLEAELLPIGFKIVRDDPHGFNRNWRSVEYGRGDDCVILCEHMRYMVPMNEGSEGIVSYDIEGWVSCQVILKRGARGSESTSAPGTEE